MAANLEQLGDAIGWVTGLGATGMLALIVIGGMRRWYVWRAEYDQMRRDRDYWRDTAVRALELGEYAARTVRPPSSEEGPR